MIDFLGVGAQKSGTSWAYTCLYEHPQICAPIKEIHFFSRPRFEKGYEWYESHFKGCANGKLQGEFSTSYLYSKEAPARIHARYPEMKIIAILRNPVERAYSQYRNSIKSGEINESKTFDEYMKEEVSVIEQGRYAEQLERYLTLFPSENVQILIYEDIRRDPVIFMRRIYEFLGVDPTFVSSMVHDEINVARTPKSVFIDRVMHHVSETLRKAGLDRLVHAVRKSGLPDLVRKGNTKSTTPSTKGYDHKVLAGLFRDDATKLGSICGRDMVKEWNLI